MDTIVWISVFVQTLQQTSEVDDPMVIEVVSIENVRRSDYFFGAYCRQINVPNGEDDGFSVEVFELPAAICLALESSGTVSDAADGTVKKSTDLPRRCIAAI